MNRRTLLAGGVAAGVGARAVLLPSPATAAPVLVPPEEESGSLMLRSSFAGGENTFDSTSRITIESYQRAQQTNTAGEYAHYGEGIRLRLMRANAKNMIAWEDAFTDPANPRAIAWVGAHYLPNDIGDPVHQHWSIEVSDAAGHLRTRLAVNYGVDWANVRTTNADFTVSSGGVARIAGRQHVEKVVEWSNSGDGNTSGRRWRLIQDREPEADGNLGSDFRLQHFTNTGEYIGDALTVRRTNGVVAIGAPTKELGRLHVLEPGSRHVVFAEQTTANLVWALYGGVGQAQNSRGLDFRVNGDQVGRFVCNVNGDQEWGPGHSARDVIFGRIGPHRLGTSGDLELINSDRGVILRSASGVRYRLQVDDEGNLATLPA